MSTVPDPTSRVRSVSKSRCKPLELVVRAGRRGRSGARSWTTSPRSRASSRTTRSWRRCRSSSSWSRSSAWSPSRTRSTSSCAPDADNAIPVELRALLRSALGSATDEHPPGRHLPGHRSAGRPLRLGQRHRRPRGRPRSRARRPPPALGARQAGRPGHRHRHERCSSWRPRWRPDRRLAPGGRASPSRSSARARPTSPGRVLYLIGTPSLLLFTVAVYHFGPNAPRRPLLASLPGAVVGVALWVGVTRLFALYVENFDSYKTVYGALAGAAIYLIFLFLTCVAAADRRRGQRAGRTSMRVRRRARRGARHGGRGDPHSALAGGAPVGGAVGVALAARAHGGAAAPARPAAAAVDPGALPAPGRPPGGR